MDEDEAEIHPLDRDYSLPVEPKQRPAKSKLGAPIAFHVKLRKIGFIGFAAGFVMVFLSAIVLSNTRSGTSAEGFGSVIHRLGMMLILMGGVVVVVAYRIPHLMGKVRGADGILRSSRARSFAALVFWNVVVFFVVFFATAVSPLIKSPEFNFIFINGVLTTACGLMVTLIVWHRGFLRAYAIGVLVALVINGFSAVFISFNFRYRGGGPDSLLFVHLAIILIGGLVCAGYVCLLESLTSGETQSEEDQEPVNRDLR